MSTLRILDSTTPSARVLLGARGVTLIIYQFNNVNNIDENVSSRIRPPCCYMTKIAGGEAMIKTCSQWQSLCGVHLHRYQNRTKIDYILCLQPAHGIRERVPSSTCFREAGFGPCHSVYPRDPACLSPTNISQMPENMTGLCPIPIL